MRGWHARASACGLRAHVTRLHGKRGLHALAQSSGARVGVEDLLLRQKVQLHGFLKSSAGHVREASLAESAAFALCLRSSGGRPSCEERQRRGGGNTFGAALALGEEAR
eukprot:6187543-Pleurochrysis_carterae.AAC.1